MKIDIGSAFAALASCALLCATAACHRSDDDANVQVPDYLGPAAKAAAEKRAGAGHVAPQRLVAPPADIHDGPKSPWYRVRGTGKAHAMLGLQPYGIAAFVMDGRDDGHFLTVLYKGNCHDGWQPYRTAAILDTVVSATPGREEHREEPTPSLPWVETKLGSTCSAATPSQSMTKGEAMWAIMSEGL